MQIRARTLAEAHEGAIDAVLESHKKQAIQTHADKVEQTIEFEDEDGSDDIIVIKVSNPQAEPQVSAGALFKEKFTNAYKKQFLTLTPPRADGKQATYTYFNRLEDWPYFDLDEEPYDAGGEVGLKCRGDGQGDGLTQITDLIKKLATDSRTRRAVAVTWNPTFDTDSQEPPCMNWIQFVIRNKKVNMRVIFRSQDILSGLGENLVGCAALQKYVTDGVNKYIKESDLTTFDGVYEPGSLILISTIPHIYHIRDAFELEKMKNEINRKKTFKLWEVETIR